VIAGLILQHVGLQQTAQHHHTSAQSLTILHISYVSYIYILHILHVLHILHISCIYVGYILHLLRVPWPQHEQQGLDATPP